MRNLLQISLITIILALSANSLAAAKAAKVKMLRGKVFVTKTNGKKSPLKKNLWVNVGDKIETSKKSFVKLRFTDKSTMNLGPESEIEIAKFSSKTAGLINVLKGTIRAKVTKDSKSKRSKLFLKTKTAAMGIRGTDFSITYIPSQGRTSLLTYGGEVAMVQTDPKEDVAYNKLESAVSSSTAVKARVGQYAGAGKEQKRVSTPTKISPTQFAALKRNENFENNAGKSNNKTYRNIIPPGLSAKNAISDGTLNKDLRSINPKLSLHDKKQNDDMIVDSIETIASAIESNIPGPPPEGFNDPTTGAFAPPAGGIIDMKTGVLVSPPAGSAFDPVTKTYIVPSGFGKVDPATGQVLLPRGMSINDKGEYVVKSKDGKGPGRVVGQTPPPKPMPKGPLARGPNAPGRPRPGGVPRPPLPPPPPTEDFPQDWDDPCANPCDCGGCPIDIQKTPVHFIINVVS